jgi:hypothetical protein
MHETYFVSDQTSIEHLASGYTHQSGKLASPMFIDMSWPFAAGSLESTVDDMAKWDAALYTSKLLEPDLRDKLWSPTRLSDGTTAPYGFGWIVGQDNGVPIYSHNGGIPGFMTAIRRAPSEGLTTIVLMNADDVDPMRVAKQLMGEIDPRLSDKVPGIPDDDPATTAFLRKALEGVLAGAPDQSVFSENMYALITPSFLSGIQQQKARWGDLEQFVLVKSENQNGLKSRSYKVVFTRGSMSASFVVGGTGLIESALLKPEG